MRMLLMTLCAILTVQATVFAQSASENAMLDAHLKTFRSEFVAIKPGTFQMGSNDGPVPERPVHEVAIEEPFEISKYEVWQDLYEAVMGNNPSRWQGPRNSAERMTWKDAVSFCKRATELMRERKLIEPNQEIRLPTEAQWEYSCRAGTTTAYSFGDEAQAPGDVTPKATLLDPYGWHTGNAAGNDPAVGVLKPNPWGLYDIHGYLWEYCENPWGETHDSDSSSRQTDDEGEKRVIKGGSWKDAFPSLRSSARRSFRVDAVSDAVGFRCVLVAEPNDE